MGDRFAIARRGTRADFEARVRELGGLLEVPPVWLFVRGAQTSWILPTGTYVSWIDQTRYGLSLAGVGEGALHDDVFDHLASLFELEELDAVVARFGGAETPLARLDALHGALALHLVIDAPFDPRVEAVLRAALDDRDPVVRLAAIRGLQYVPKEAGWALVEGRVDPENPALERFQQVLAP
jgi:hypothetical protein